MKGFSKISLLFVLAIFFASSGNRALAQINYPEASQRQMLSQTVGDTEVTIVYHRPNVKERKVWGTAAENALVPYGEVWRAGANENTTFEVTQDVTIDGQKLPKGKYGFHIIPTATDWTLIFNKVNDAWGSFSYKPENDALRIKVKPESAPFQESLVYTIENVDGSSADVVLAWEKVRVPFTVDIGDVEGRLLDAFRAQQVSGTLQAANYILNSKRTQNYAEAIAWMDQLSASTKPGNEGYPRITYNAGVTKSRLLAEMGKKKEAIALAEKTIAFANAENKKETDAGRRALFNPNGISNFAAQVKTWKGE